MYKLVKISQNPALKHEAATWFHEKWGIPKEAYLASMEAAIAKDPIQEWYLLLDNEMIIAGMGVIENDFHERVDLSPNIVAVYTEANYRGQGLCKRLLDFVVEDNRCKRISPIYLITDHIGLYEKMGWEFLTLAKAQNEEEFSRIYIHR